MNIIFPGVRFTKKLNKNYGAGNIARRKTVKDGSQPSNIQPAPFNYQDMKGNFWHKIFRKGYDSQDRRYDGKTAKTDPKSTRTKLKGFLDKFDLIRGE